MHFIYYTVRFFTAQNGFLDQNLLIVVVEWWQEKLIVEKASYSQSEITWSDRLSLNDLRA